MVTEFIGKLHPLLIHLPIGVILVFILFEFIQLNNKIEKPKKIIQIIILLGVISGIASLISGYFLSLQGLHEGDILDRHKWIATSTIIAFTVYGYVTYFHIIQKKIKFALLTFLLILILTTGHLGGTLTHGENYWDFILSNGITNNQIKTTPYTVKNIEEARVFDDLIMVPFKQKCIQCHGLDRQKGKLRLDGKEWVLKGGEDGEIIDLNNPEKSEILKRIFLDLDEEQHMPPKNKQQLSEDEKNIIEWWVSAGAPFNKKVSEIEKSLSLDSILNHYHNKLLSERIDSKKDREKIVPISSEKLESLIKYGWVVSPISKTDNHIRVVGFNLEKPLDSCLDQLLTVKEHVIELKLSFQKINKNNILKIADFVSLEKLWLDNGEISEKSIQPLSNLKNLTYLNISSNSLTTEDILSLGNLKMLEKLYIQNTRVEKTGVEKLMKIFSGAKIYAFKDSMKRVSSDTLFIKK